MQFCELVSYGNKTNKSEYDIAKHVIKKKIMNINHCKYIVKIIVLKMY